MTNQDFPEWVQAAIAKLNEKYAEKRQQAKEQGSSYLDGFADGLETAETILMREFERAETQSGWISVTDRFPESAETVLVFMDNGVWSGFHDTESWFVHGWSKNPFKVTHWRPMPQPPKASE